MKKLALPLVVAWIALAPSAQAETFTVNSLADHAADACAAECTLRDAINASNTAGDPADEINFAVSGTHTLGVTGQLEVTASVTISGNGISATKVDGNDAVRVFHVTAGSGVTLANLTVQNGNASAGPTFAEGGGAGLFLDNAAGSLNLAMVRVTGNTLSTTDNNNAGGAGIRSKGILTITDSTIDGNDFFTNTHGITGGGITLSEGADLTLTRSTVSGNNAGTGGSAGGIYFDTGTSTIVNSTISGNSAGQAGGGLHVDAGVVNVVNSTVANNTANASDGAFTGGGAFIGDGAGITLNVKNSIFAGNVRGTAAPVADNCIDDGAGVIGNQNNNIDSGTSCGFGALNGNKENTDPLLGALGNNGGTTETMALPATSPALNGASNDCGGAPVGGVDQRGTVRPQGAACDIGAFERQVPTVATTGDVLAYQANNSTPVDPNLVLAVPDGTSLAGATISLSGGFSAGQDVLEVDNQAGIVASYNASTGVLTLTGSASAASYQTALRAVRYRNSAEAPSTANRTISFTVSEAVLASAVATRTVSVAAPAGGGDPGGGDPGGGDPGGGDPDPDPDPDPDTTDPRLTAFNVNPASFAAAKKGGSVSAKKKVKVGAKVSYRLSEAASLEFTVLRRKAGRRAGGECKARTKKNKGKKKCDLPVGGFSLDGEDGTNSFKFTGRVGGAQLAHDKYWMEVDYFDAAGNAGKTAKAAFKIVKR